MRFSNGLTRSFQLFLVVGLVLTLMMSTSSASENQNLPVSRVERNFSPADDNQIDRTPADRGIYSGTVRVYIVEPVSRYRDYGGVNYEFGALDIPFDSIVDFEYQDSFSRTITWTAADGNVSSINETNIAAQVVIFNPEGFLTSSDTAGGNDHNFIAHYADGCAYAEAGHTGTHNPDASNTHTVFLEESTGST
jgi:hypothetical protein